MSFGWGIVSTGKHPDIKIAPAMAGAILTSGCLPVLTMPHPNGIDAPQAGRFALRNVRTCRTASGIFSFVSFHGKKVSSDFGASIADSMAGS